MFQENDWFLEKQGVGRLHHITTCFDKCKFKIEQSFHFRVTRIYDPSKFWIVVRYRELEVFQKDLFKWYYLNKSKYRIPENKIENDMYCVAFTDSGYYRGLVMGFPRDLQVDPGVQIYFIDYGTFKTVEIPNVYYMSKMYAEVPQFVVRVSMAGICPKATREWTNDDFKAFSEIANDKILVGVVVNIDKSRQVLEIRCSVDGKPVDELLVEQQRARYCHEKLEMKNQKTLFEPKLKYPFLFPSHSALESGKIPQTISDFEYLLNVSPYSSVVARYYKEK